MRPLNFSPTTALSVTQLRDLAHQLTTPSPMQRNEYDRLAEFIARAPDHPSEITPTAVAEARRRLQSAADRGNDTAAAFLARLDQVGGNHAE